MHLLNIQPTKIKWVLDEEQKNLYFILNKLGIRYKKNRFSIFTKYNYLSSRYMLDTPYYIPKVPWQKYYIDYYHGGLNGEYVFERNIKNIIKNQDSIQKIRVSSSLYENILIKKGVMKEKLNLIPIPVNTKIYFPINESEIENIKRELKIKEDTLVIGSFQKDGIGWSENAPPKLIKGPDIFIETLLLIKREIKNITVILTGNSRAYVIKRLKEIGIKYIYLNGDDPKYRAKLYNILDVYLICSREEGGPKGFLESIACKTPVITTNVGQIYDIGEDGKNCFISKSLNPEDIFQKFMEFINLRDKKNIDHNMLITARNNSLIEVVKKWKDFFSDLDN